VSLGAINPESDLQLEVYSTTDGGNQIVLANNTKGVGTYWDYGLNKSIKQQDTVVFPFLGEQSIKFSGFCDGGIITTIRKVTITKIDHVVAPEWAIFAGKGANGKKWSWDYEKKDDIVYGNGGYLASLRPAWWQVSAGTMETGDFKQVLSDYMEFDLNGGPNFTKKRADGSVIEKGTFKFDMSKIKKLGDGNLYAIGELQFLDASILFAVAQDDGNKPIFTFDIISLTEDKMVLAYAVPGTGAWGNAYFWCFKSIK
ncbi:MAG: hypothetical protein RSA92_06515, partial [Bacteroidaceae bacterium]